MDATCCRRVLLTTAFLVLGGCGTEPVDPATTYSCVDQTAESRSALEGGIRVEGPGYFVLAPRDGAGLVDTARANANPERWRYSTDGRLAIDTDGVVIHPAGEVVLAQPTPAPSSLDPATLAPIVVAPHHPPRATRHVFVGVELSSSDDVPVQVFDLEDPTWTSRFSSSVSIVDHQGGAHAVTLYYTRTGKLAYTFHAVAESYYGPAIVTGGRLDFHEDGHLLHATNEAHGWWVAHGVEGPELAFVFGGQAFDDDVHRHGGEDPSSRRTVLRPSPFGVGWLSHDGFLAGDAIGIDVASNGTLTAGYSSGQTIPLGRIVLATFDRPCALEPVADVDGAPLFAATRASGPPRLAAPDDDSPAGALIPGRIEPSS